MITAIVFDFDGVLADSEVLHLESYQAVLEPLGLELTRSDYFARYLGFDDHGVFSTLAADHGLSLSNPEVAALIARKSTVFDALEARAEMLFPGAEACVRRLAEEYPLGIASGARRHEIESVLDRSRPARLLCLRRRLGRHSGGQTGAGSIPAEPPSCIAARRTNAWRSRTRAGAWSPLAPRGSRAWESPRHIRAPSSSSPTASSTRSTSSRPR